jgi:hypothetical protein
MHRIIRPGGFLVITIHGWIASQSKVTDEPTSTKCMKAMTEQGHFYVAAFPGNVDWDPDTKNPDWGMSWVDVTWLQKRLASTWTIELLLNGRNDCLQDVIVLRPNH